MAVLFQFNGDPKAYGKPVIEVRTCCSDGTRTAYSPPGEESGWQVGQVLNHTCPRGDDGDLSGGNGKCRCWRALRVDTRFTEL